MRLLDLTLPTPQENLACDEVLLDLAEEGTGGETLRFWEPTEYFVVVGYGDKIETEVDTAFCRQNNLSILRRCTGGGTVLQGPGILNYSLVLSTDSAGPCHSITAANAFIMERHRDLIASVIDPSGARTSARSNPPIEVQGHTDLTIGGRKFSGNSQRRKKRFLLFHGSFLLRFDISMIERALPMPSKQPDYRQRRSHAEFLANLDLPSDRVKTVLAGAWQAAGPLSDLPLERISSLARLKYSSDEWILRRLAHDRVT